MAGDDPHMTRVIAARGKLLDFLAGLEEDSEIFPEGLPDDPDERLKQTSMLNADALGSALACLYLGHFGITPNGPKYAEQWFTEVLTVMQKTIQREQPHHRFDWKRLRELGEQLWNFSADVPDTLPEDI